MAEKPKENEKVVIPLLEVSVDLLYRCPECGEIAVGGDEKVLNEKNSFRAEVQPWQGKCEACQEEVRTPRIIIFTQELKLKTDPPDPKPE
jgi:hypothetical protein